MESVRTCVGCRGREKKADLLRLTVVDGGIHLDSAQRRPGRGVYLHRRESCWEQASRKRALGRGLRAPQADPGPALEELRRGATESDAAWRSGVRGDPGGIAMGDPLR